MQQFFSLFQGRKKPKNQELYHVKSDSDVLHLPWEKGRYFEIPNLYFYGSIQREKDVIQSAPDFNIRQNHQKLLC